MPRPTDWDVLGLDSDPTPGDPDRIDQVIASLNAIGGVANDIDAGLASLITDTEGNFISQTATELRNKVDKHLRGFVQSLGAALTSSATALTTYVAVMRDKQFTADNALSQARGVAEDERDSYRNTAQTAGSEMAGAAGAASATIGDVAYDIQQPVSGCELFWEAFQWLAIILIVPALIFGGPVALLAIAVNLTLFIKAAVDFANGRIGFLDLFLAGLGLIAPTTRAVPIFQLLGRALSFTWNGLRAFAIGAFNMFRGIAQGIVSRPFAFLPGIRDFARLAGGWVRDGALWVRNGIGNLPAFANIAVTRGGLWAINGIRGIPGMLTGRVWPAIQNGWRATTGFLDRELGGNRWLRIFLPVEVDELGQGVWRALRLSVFERGVLGQHLYGMPILRGIGTAVGAIPTPPVAGHTAHALVDMSLQDLSRIRLGDWAGGHDLSMPSFALPQGGALHAPAPPSLTINTSLGDAFTLGRDAVRRVDALLDMPVAKLVSTTIGDWATVRLSAAGRVTLDDSLGISALAATRPVDTAAMNLLGPATPTLPTVHAMPSPVLAGGHAMPGPGRLDLTGNVTGAHFAGGTPTLDQTLGVLLNAPRTPEPAGLGVHRADGLHIGQSSVAPPPLAAGPHLTTVAATGAAAPPGPALAGRIDAALNLLAGAGRPAHAATDLGGAGRAATDLGAGRATVDLGAGRPGALTPPRPPDGPAGGPGLPDALAGAGSPGPLTRPADPALAGASRGTATAAPVTPLSPMPMHLAAAPAPPHPPGRPPADPPAGPPPPRRPGDGRTFGQLTPAERMQAWEYDAGRVLRLFGDEGDPLREVRLRAWRGYTAAQTDLRRAEHLVELRGPRPDPGQPVPGGSSPRPAGLAEQLVANAADRLDSRTRALTALGIDPSAMERRIAAIAAESQLTRPRLDAGMLGRQDGAGTAVGQPNPGLPNPGQPAQVVTSLPLADLGNARIVRDATGPRIAGPGGGASPWVVVRHGANGSVLHVHNPGTGARFRIANDAITHRLGPPIAAPGTGGIAGHHVATPFPGGGAASLVDGAGALLATHTVRAEGGSFDIVEVAADSLVRVNADGAFAGRGTRQIAGAGPGADGNRVFTGAGAPRLVAQDGGAVANAPQVRALPGGGFRLTWADGRFARLDGTGAFVERATPRITGAGPGLNGHRVFVAANGAVRFADNHGTVVATHTAAAAAGGGFRLTADGGSLVRVSADGAFVERATPLITNAGPGLDGNRVFVDANGPRFADDQGNMIATHTVAAAGNGFRFTSVADNSLVRVNGAGVFAERATPPITGAGPGLNGHRVLFDADGPWLADGGGAAIADAPHVRALNGGEFRLTAADGSFVRVNGTGAFVERATAQIRGAGPRLDGNRVFVDANGPRFADDQGAPIGTHQVHAQVGGEFRLDGAAGDWARVGRDGRRTAVRTAPVNQPGGLLHQHLIEQPRGGPPVLLDAAGDQVPGAVVRPVPDGSFDVVPPPAAAPAAAPGPAPVPGPVHRIDGAGTVTHLEAANPANRHLPLHQPRGLLDGHLIIDSTQPNGAAALIGDNAARFRLETQGNGFFKITDDIGAEVFQRRPRPAGGVLDSYRPINFGRFTQRARWVEVGGNGVEIGHGVRHYDTSGRAWYDMDNHGHVVHEYRDAIDGGHIFATRENAGWRWYRYGADRANIAHGDRQVNWWWGGQHIGAYRRGGWVDRLPNGGGVAQQQRGVMHLPALARTYDEHVFDQTGRTEDFARQSPQGKDMGGSSVLNGQAPQTHRLTVIRWAEQRSPDLFRRIVWRGNDSRLGGEFQWLHGDNRPRYAFWSREQLTPPPAQGAAPARAQGFRFISISDSRLDIDSAGNFARYSGNLHHGDRLHVGDDLVAANGAAPAADAIPWREQNSGLTGFRVRMGDGQAAIAHGGGWGRPVAWEDRFTDAANPAQWRVARLGLDDGTVVEFGPPRNAAANGTLASRQQAYWEAGRDWIRKDFHGRVIGRGDSWSDLAGGHVQITAHGPQERGRFSSLVGRDERADHRRWTWQDGQGGQGDRVIWRGNLGSRQPFDDSFRDFNANHEAIRDRRMLDGGEYVDAWHDGARWEWQRYDRFGNVKPVPGGIAGQQIRRWAGVDGRWQDDWFAGAVRFRDEIVTGDIRLIAREVPGNQPIFRIREYDTPIAVRDTPASLTWRELDHGSVVRFREERLNPVDPAAPARFFEKDNWWGQWRLYDQAGLVIAKRTDTLFVHSGDGLDNLHVVGREMEFRGPLTELRGWGRRTREPNRMQWSNTPGRGEALYKSYPVLVLEKVLVDLGQELVLEFAANIIINAIVEKIRGGKFDGQDVLKSFANAALGGVTRTVTTTLLHDTKWWVFDKTRNLKHGVANIDLGQPYYRRPINHDDYYTNEWATNGFTLRWRAGSYDFLSGLPVGALGGFVNGSFNAAVFGVTDSNGQVHHLHGGDAAREGAIGMATGLSGAVTGGALRFAAFGFAGSRFFARQGLNDFLLNLVARPLDKGMSAFLTDLIRTHLGLKQDYDKLPDE
ncbi:hypothetical protein [Dactylosporangium sp. CA-092794]|uniref:hypothetical protein n=1 Tax=Dactylosporangium sp. CA-092794 TaxID=3239929 RepID=UPI003D8AF8B2